ncbi:MAG: N-acetylmuramoyl-L-alanine amidase, partial [Hyphomicrobiales bacterium]
MTPRAIAIASTMVCALLCDSAGLAAESTVTEHVLAAAAEQPVVATDLRIGGDDKQTRFVVDLNRKIDLAAFTLADPYRVVVDLPQVTFKLPAKAGAQSRGLIKAFRYGLIMQGGSRIVLDTKGPVRIEKAFVLDAADGQLARLVLDLAATDRAGFMRNISLQARPVHNAGVKPSEPPVKVDGDARPLVVIDPGHGGIDNGTKGSGGELEKEIVLAFSQALREKLESGGKYRTVMTRSDDSFIPLAERVRFA